MRVRDEARGRVGVRVRARITGCQSYLLLETLAVLGRTVPFLVVRYRGPHSGGLQWLPRVHLVRVRVTVRVRVCGSRLGLGLG